MKSLSSFPLALTLLAAAALSSCDDTLFLVGGQDTGASSQGGWCAAQSLFDSSCVACHSPAGGNQGGLDLRTDPYNAIVGVQSANYPSRTLVVAGDPSSSFLLLKLQGLQASSEGVQMPLAGPLPQATLDKISSWIADGATDVCTVDTGVTVACDATNEDCKAGTCGGEGGNMLPGADCLVCHKSGGGEATRWTVAGTAFTDLYGTNKLAGATIHIVDNDGATTDLTTNSVGNFWTAKAIAMPFNASITTNAGTLSMAASQSTGACNSCHQCGGAAGGKLNAP